MKQVLQDLKDGKTFLVDVPCPQLRRGYVLIRTEASLISLGTERALVSFGKASYLEKARQQPEKVRQVFNKVKTDGLLATIEAVQARLDAPLQLGYCNAGVILEVGEGVEGFTVGDRVISNGPHAEVVSVPKNLCARIPDGVPFDHACYTVLGSIALQGVRLLGPTLGESVVVIGLGLVGLMAVQILRAQGCQVLGVDFDARKCGLARELGVTAVDLGGGENALAATLALSDGQGADAVLVTASTVSSDPMNQAAELCRKRGRIVQVGTTGLNLVRDAFYRKEILVQVSCSYGPGRYDSGYEEGGHDYPLPYVRWTEQRNFTAVLGLLAAGTLKVAPLTTHRVPISRAPEAYDELVAKSGGALGIVIDYTATDPKEPVLVTTRSIALPKPPPAALAQIVVGAIGAGAFGARITLPGLRKAGVRLHTIASRNGVSGTLHGKKLGFERSTTDVAEILGNSEINAVFITTQHNTHAEYVVEALRAGKRVYVEKPLCLNRRELDAIREAHARAENPFLMVGFNRRFAPQVVEMKQLLGLEREPKAIIVTVNAGVLPNDHWHHSLAVGGGRLIAEGCHFVDLIRFLTGQPIRRLEAVQMGEHPSLRHVSDKVTVTMRMADGSIGTLHYFGNGAKDYPKERVEVFVGGKILQLDNFRSLRGYGWQNFRSHRLWRQDKGHAAEIAAVVSALKAGRASPIPFAEIDEVTEATLSALERAPTA